MILFVDQTVYHIVANEMSCINLCYVHTNAATIEFCRNVLGWRNANSTEINPDCDPKVVIDMPEHTGIQMGGTMRLGKRRTTFVEKDSIIRTVFFIIAIIIFTIN